jgi:hypothetical protein
MKKCSKSEIKVLLGKFESNQMSIITFIGMLNQLLERQAYKYKKISELAFDDTNDDESTKILTRLVEMEEFLFEHNDMNILKTLLKLHEEEE